MRLLSFALICALCALVAPTSLLADSSILIDEEAGKEIEKAQERLKTLGEYLEEAKELGLGDDINGRIDDGLRSVNTAKKGLEKGLKAIDLAETMIKLHTNYQCLEETKVCMTTQRTPNCVKAYAFGMSTLFQQMYDILDGNTFEWSRATAKTNLALAIYTPALKFAADTFAEAATLGQICKTRGICELLCSDPANHSVFGCQELMQEQVVLGEACHNLKKLVESNTKGGDEDSGPPPADIQYTEKMTVDEMNHHYSLVLKFIDSAEENARNFNEPVQKVLNARTRLLSAKSTFDQRYVATLQSSSKTKHQLLDVASCELQDALVLAYATTQNQPDTFRRVMEKANSLGRCYAFNRNMKRLKTIPRAN